MANKIEIHIGDRLPHEYWNRLHDNIRILHNAATQHGWIGWESGRDIEFQEFMADFFRRMNEQRPPKIPQK